MGVLGGAAAGRRAARPRARLEMGRPVRAGRRGHAHPGPLGARPDPAHRLVRAGHDGPGLHGPGRAQGGGHQRRQPALRRAHDRDHAGTRDRHRAPPDRLVGRGDPPGRRRAGRPRGRGLPRRGAARDREPLVPSRPGRRDANRAGFRAGRRFGCRLPAVPPRRQLGTRSAGAPARGRRPDPADRTCRSSTGRLAAPRRDARPAHGLGAGLPRGHSPGGLRRLLSALGCARQPLDRELAARP